MIFPPAYVQREKGHGRIETRTIQVSSIVKDFVQFPYVEQVARLHYVSTDLKGENRKEETRYLITSLPTEKAGAKELLELARGHWSIENSLHWVRDVTFDEDRSQVRTGAGPRTLATLRNLAISLLRLFNATGIAESVRWIARKAERALKIIGA